MAFTLTPVADPTAGKDVRTWDATATDGVGNNTVLTHTLGFTPEWVMLMPMHANFLGYAVFVAGITATTITLTQSGGGALAVPVFRMVVGRTPSE